MRTSQITARILLADDHGIVRQGLRAVLSRDPSFEVVGETGDGREAVRLAETLEPNIVIMDITMPQLNGIDATAQIVRRNPRTGVIILSMHLDETYLLRALQAGAKGYLLKDSAEVDLVRAVQAVERGRTFFSPSVTETMLEDYMRYMQQRNLEDSYGLLTDREKEVLQLLAEGKSNKDVAVSLQLSPHTVESHRTNLMQKLNLHNTAEIVLYAVRKKIIG
ncbi:MAG TPA: response regulator transcription factor [Bryobacteraceae bacterium]|nr:response regulator transcription factor [Bryobacteraceae bacterium]